MGWFMSVRSLTTNELLPRSVTRTRLRTGVGVGRGEAVAEGEAEGDGALPTVGVEPLQADAMRAVTARVRIQSAVFMCLEG
jgi:hypothetical protein